MEKKGPANLPQLQNFIKRDPESYEDEFGKQFESYTQFKEVFRLNPSTKINAFTDLVMFISQVAQCYPGSEEVRNFPHDIIKLLRLHGPVMHHDTRLSLMKAMVLLRNKDMLAPLLLLDVCFDMLRCQDKLLKSFLQLHITTDIKNINAHSKNQKLNKELQLFFKQKLSDNNAVVVKTALEVMINLYLKGVWANKQNVNSIATACFSKEVKIMVRALKFFVGNDEGVNEEVESSDEEPDAPNVKKALLAMKVNKKNGKKRQNQVDKIKKAANSMKRKDKGLPYDYSALHLLYDPQTMAEKLLRKYQKRSHKAEVKLLIINMISRLIGIHELYVPNFYSTIQKHLFPKSDNVTKYMTYAAQASHAHMPPDELAGLLKCLANNFVTEHYGVEAVSMGLNAIREVCNRNIHGMDEDLLADLLGYIKHKDKGVFMAARSIMTLFREKNPALLARKLQAAPTELIKEMGIAKFGQQHSNAYIPGAEILAFKPDNYNQEVSDSEDEDSEEEDESSEDEVADEGSFLEGEESVLEGDESVLDGEESIMEDDGDEEWEDMDSGEDMEDEECDADDESDLDEDQNKSSDKIVKTKVKPKSCTKKQALKEVMKMTPEERKESAEKICSTRFLTDSDYSWIEAAQAAKKVERFKNKKRKLEDIEAIEDDDREIVPLSSIEMIHKKRRHDKLAIMEHVKAGKEGRSYGSTRGRQDPFASTTNKEKRKEKAFGMVKHKVRSGKQQSSFKDRAKKLKISLLRQLKNS